MNVTGKLPQLYQPNLALLTDLYQLTMAYGYWHEKAAPREAIFHLFFRKHPFDGEFAIAAGLADAIDYIRDFHFSTSDLDYLAELEGSDRRPLFPQEFLRYLQSLRINCDIDAMPEGTVAFAQEPLLRVSGPLIECQLLETALLTLINFSTLVATKAARICQAAGSDEVIEFGLRRAQGIDGGVAASRAAFIGGAQSTSNVLAGKLFDIPVRGTHAHSWVMAFPSELEAFRRYAAALPANCVFLVDTYDTVEGVWNAVKVGQELRAKGHEILGVRLDSGDMAALSIEARSILDEGGFPEAKIVASSDLDEYEILALKARGAKIDIWGVGTRLATAYEQPALGGVYKLAAIRERGGPWQPKVKLSNDRGKSTMPGKQQVRRFAHGGEFLGDAIYDELTGAASPPAAIDFADGRRRDFCGDAIREDLLVPIFRAGELVYRVPSAVDARQRTLSQLRALPAEVQSLQTPKRYSVGLDPQLDRRRRDLLAEVKT